MRPSSTSTSWLAAAAFAAIAIAAALALWQLFALSPIALVEDEAAVLAVDQRKRIAEFHDLLLQDHGIDYRVVTLRDAGDINAAAARKFAALSTGMRSESGRALLLMIDTSEDLVRMEVSHSLEPVYTDAFTKYIESRQMVPFFQSGRVADGILATTELIVAKAQEAERQGSLDVEEEPAKSSGAGATSDALIGKADKRTGGDSADVRAGSSPAKTLQEYMAAMASRNGAPDLTLYTSATRAMLQRWTITPAQMDMIVKSYRRCTAEPVQYEDDLAVIRYPIEQRTCAPFFFRRSQDGWQLDLTMMQDVIRFGRSNSWRLDLSVDHPYKFAFTDWTFDSNGFPRNVK